jgi:uncharacterized membrane protein YdjX (TVP38/TMEM64 family)
MGIKNIFLIYFAGFLMVLFSLFYFDLINFMDPKFAYQYFLKFKNLIKENLILSSVVFLIISIIWISLMGIATIIFVIAGIIFNPLLGSIIAIIALVSGSLILFFLSKKIINKKLKEKILKKENKYIKFLNKNSFWLVVIFRLIPGLPLPLKNILPSFTNISYKNFLFTSIIADIPNVTLNVLMYNSIFRLVENKISNTQTLFTIVIILTIMIIIFFSNKYLLILKNKFIPK